MIYSKVLIYKVLSRTVFLLIIVFTFVLHKSFSQTVSVSGYVIDSITGESLIGANIYTDNFKNYTSTNNYGHFNIISSLNNCICISYVGYTKVRFCLTSIDTVLTIKLIPDNKIDEIKIIGKRDKNRYLGMHSLDSKSIKLLPVIAGETDVLKTIQLLPGIQGGIEGTSGFHVRGSSPDQNLILVDGVPVYNVNHLFGVFSVFNTDAINNVQVYKGIFPAQYGGRIASVVDITMKEGNNQKYHGNLSIGLISSKFLFEGPLKSEKTSFLFTARRTYFDLFMVPVLWLLNNREFTGGYYFYDINAKINHRLNSNNRLYFSMYTGKDKYYLRGNEKYYDNDGNVFFDKSRNNTNWNNLTTLLRLNKNFNIKHFVNIAVSYTKYALENYEMWESEKQKDTLQNKTEFEQKQISKIIDYSLAFDGNYSVTKWYSLKYGSKQTFHKFKPGNDLLFISDIDQMLLVDTSFNGTSYYTSELNNYIESEIKLGIFEANIGIRHTYYHTNEKNYNVFEPRLLVNLNISEHVTFRAGYANNYQFIHLLTKSTIGFPTDQWLPVTSSVLPVFAKQISAGVEFKLNDYKLSIDYFDKKMENLLEFKEAASIANWEELVTQGKGNAWGFEFFLSKETGKLNRWLSYTYSVSNRRFNELNFGKTFPYKYDRKHDLKIVGIKNLVKSGNCQQIGCLQPVMPTHLQPKNINRQNQRIGNSCSTVTPCPMNYNILKTVTICECQYTIV